MMNTNGAAAEQTTEGASAQVPRAELLVNALERKRAVRSSRDRPGSLANAALAPSRVSSTRSGYLLRF